jgi:7,8-dihydropterin-6-yl-methyl-4-(beta-D-ribofuranosyl)aminobenzene 5'-phosphate synthase
MLSIADRSILREFARSLVILLAVCASFGSVRAGSNSSQHVHSLKITVLATNLAGNPHEGIGEWGYSALVESDGHRLLYDTGASPDMVLNNAKALGIDLSDVEEVVLSHNHWDHVGGLMSLRRALMKINPRAMSRVHVGSGIFEPRLTDADEDKNGLRSIRAEYLQTGGQFIVHDGPTELFPGAWLTGPVPRPNAEKNWSPGLSLVTEKGRVEDNVPEDSALLFDTDSGIVLLTGCAHAGVVNIAQYARVILGEKPFVAIVGGLHLFAATEQAIAWTGKMLKGLRVQSLLAGHCTGFEATYRLRESLGLTRKTAVVSAVGSSFTLGKGIDARLLAQ